MIRSLISYPRMMSARAVLVTLPHKIKQDAEDALYRLYIARCARVITENTAKASGGGYIKADFDDILHPKAKDTRTGDEIAADVIERAGLEVVD